MLGDVPIADVDRNHKPFHNIIVMDRQLLLLMCQQVTPGRYNITKFSRNSSNRYDKTIVCLTLNGMFNTKLLNII